jgi:hypothetical protein
MIIASAAKSFTTEHPELENKVLAVVLYGAGEGKNTGKYAAQTLANCAPGDFVGFQSGATKRIVSVLISISSGLPERWNWTWTCLIQR